MGFLSPWFLAGAAAVGLPVWLHLLRRHRSEPLRFSSIMLFEPRTQSSIQHRRLQHLLLFALRVALLLMLALAFASPFIQRDRAAAAQGHRLHLLVVDRSFSMRASAKGAAGTNLLGRAKQEALSAISSMKSGDLGQVVELESHVRILTQPVSEASELRAAVQGIEPGDSRASFGELAQSVRSIAQSSRIPVVLHLFSDMQRTAMPAAFSDMRLPEGVELTLHTVSNGPSPNFAVETVSAPRRLYDVKKARVQATVAGYGTEAAKKNVSLVVNGKVAASKLVEVPAKGRATVEFTGMEAPYGLNRGEVRIGGESGDVLPEDDHYNFAVERSDPKKILFLYEARQPRAALYFRNALEASADAAFSLDPMPVEQAANLLPSRYAGVVLSDVAAVPPALLEALASYVRKGGAVLIAVGPVAGARPRVPLFDGAVLDSRYESRAGERFQMATEVDISHPALARANRLDGVKFYRTVKVDPGQARVLAKLGDGTPLLMEKQVGEGKVMVFTSTFDNISNDFPLHASFVPFIEQTAYHLSGDEERPSSAVVDNYVELRSGKDQGTAVEVLGPDGKRVLTLEEAATARNVVLSKAGFYELRRANGRHELMAANPDRRESDLSTVPQETLDLWQRTGQGGAAPGKGSEQQNRQPFGLWWYVMLLALLAALAESWVASRTVAGSEDTGLRKPSVEEEPGVLVGIK